MSRTHLLVKSKNTYRHGRIQKIFNTRLREDSKAAGKWETDQGGEYYAAGVADRLQVVVRITYH